MDWLNAIIVDPWDHAEGWVAYLAAPILTSILLARLKPDASRTGLIVLSVVISAVLYFALWIALYGVSSTLVIGVMFAVVVYALVCTLTVGILRSSIQAASPSA